MFLMKLFLTIFKLNMKKSIFIKLKIIASFHIIRDIINLNINYYLLINKIQELP